MSKRVDKKIRLTIGMKGMRVGGIMMGRSEMRRGMEYKNGKGKMMEGKLEDIIAKEREMSGSYNF